MINYVVGGAAVPQGQVVIEAAAGPSPPSPEAESFYAEALGQLAQIPVPFLLSGTYAVAAYTGISRPTKDLDIFCKPGDRPRILTHFQRLGFEIEIEDERWIGKVRRNGFFFDAISGLLHGMAPVTDQWFEEARQVVVLGTPVCIVGPTELVWSKAFIQLRHRYDGADVAHMILKQHDAINWRRLLSYMEGDWEVLLVHLLNFRWIYPSERNHAPRWLLEELLERLELQLDLPPPQLKVCRGRMFSGVDYEIDIREWGFGDVGGEGVAP